MSASNISAYLLGRSIEQDNTLEQERARERAENALSESQQDNQALRNANRQALDSAYEAEEMAIAAQKHLQAEQQNFYYENANLKSQIRQNRDAVEAELLKQKAQLQYKHGFEKIELKKESMLKDIEMEKQVKFKELEWLSYFDKHHLATSIKFILMNYNQHQRALFQERIKNIIDSHEDINVKQRYLDIINHEPFIRTYLELARDIAIQDNPKNLFYVKKGKINEETYLFNLITQEIQNPFHPYARYYQFNDNPNDLNLENMKAFYKERLGINLSEQQAKQNLKDIRGDIRTVWSTDSTSDFKEQVTRQDLKKLEVKKIQLNSAVFDPKDRNEDWKSRNPAITNRFGFNKG